MDEPQGESHSPWLHGWDQRPLDVHVEETLLNNLTYCHPHSLQCLPRVSFGPQLSSPWPSISSRCKTHEHWIKDSDKDSSKRGAIMKGRQRKTLRAQYIQALLSYVGHFARPNYYPSQRIPSDHSGRGCVLNRRKWMLKQKIYDALQEIVSATKSGQPMFVCSELKMEMECTASVIAILHTVHRHCTKHHVLNTSSLQWYPGGNESQKQICHFGYCHWSS